MWAEKLVALHDSQPRGPAPTFSVCHLLLTILELGHGFVGRKKLAEDIGVGEGTVRTIISRLRSAGLVSTMAAGCTLTPSGQELYDSITRDIEFFTPPNQLPMSGASAGLLLHSMSYAIGKGLEERDAAVRAGAGGAMIMTYEGGRLIMPGLADVSQEHPEEASMLETLLKLRHGDVILVVWADDPKTARCAALDTCIRIMTKNSRVAPKTHG